ncbi:MAG TPA: glycosyltransferase, partial [Sphingomonadaceae bacterium]|nr:glycosyltransferase [Sphingomonadaceae bacterium]
PLLHHEFSLEECGKSGWRRDWYRQIALGRTAGLIVASRELERMAVESWSQPRNRVHRIEPGIDLAAFERPPRPDFLPLLVKHADEFWIGTCLAQEPAESLLSLTRIFARTPDKWQLVVLGEGVDRARIEHETERLGIEHRVHLLGDNASHKEVFGLFDIFVVAPDGGQSSLTAIEAMAAGLPIVARSAGDIADLVSDRNARYIVPPGDEGGFGDCLAELVESPDERRAVGEANRQMAKERFARERMVERYRRLYAATMGAVPPR